MKFAVCMGINDYSWLSPTASLRGCVADAREWMDLLLDCYGFSCAHLLLDAAATPQGLRGALSRIAEQAVAGDTVAITYSGHGTRVPDLDGDEPDGYDEAIVLTGRPYTDDEFAGDLKIFNRDIRVVVVADSCHSGTVTRALAAESVAAAHPPLTRYADLARPIPDAPPPRRLHHRFGAPRDASAYASRILLAGCKAEETSADAWLAGAYHGALTFHATRLLRERPWRTWREFGKLLRPCVRRTSTQTPQLEGADAALDAPAFGGAQ